MHPDQDPLDLDEDLALALALSASEAEAQQRPSDLPEGTRAAAEQRPAGPGVGTGLSQYLSRLTGGLKRILAPKDQRPSAADPPPPPPSQQQQPRQPPWGPAPGRAAPRSDQAVALGSCAGDEALARALQEELDREQQQQGHWQQPHSPPPPGNPYLEPRTASQFETAPPPRPHAPSPTRDTGGSGCAGCGQPLLSLTTFFGRGGQYINALGRSWHPACFKCAACGRPFGGGTQFSVKDRLPYHPECHRQLFHPKCRVCNDFLPVQDSGRQIVWSETPFWKDRYCPAHNQDGTKRCTGCTRLQPRGEQWADLEDGRVLCLECLDTLVADTADCQPLWEGVLRFYAEMGMPLPARPPMFLVPSGALNDAERNETHGAGRDGPVFHTRGLCLTEEYTSIAAVMRMPRAGAGAGGGLLPGSYAVQQQAVHSMWPSQTRVQVTAILVLAWLPRLLTGSILAHEAMHAWLRLSGFTRLAPEVEEGLCQLMALLWLEKQQQRQGSYEERLASFLAHQVRTDPSYVYGEGFRAAHEAFQRCGLQTCLAHLRHAGKLPS